MLKGFTLGTFIVSVVLINSVQAQDFLPTSKNPEFQRSFAEMERSFYEWSKENDLKKTKGWKWYKRWEAHYQSRLNPDGSFPDESILYQEVEKLNLQKQYSRNAGWAPVGPEVMPASLDPITSHGMGRINCVTFHPTDSNTLWAGVAQGGVWKTTNNGQSWTPLTDDLPVLRISDIAVNPTNPDIMYISVGDYAYLGVALKTDGRKRNTHYGIGVYKTTDGGNTWTESGLTTDQIEYDASLIRRVIINPDNTNELVAAGIKGIWKSYDAGNNWVLKYPDIIWDIEANPFNILTLYASTGYIQNLDMGNASIIKSTNFGESWTTLPSTIPGQLVQRIELSISRADTNYIYAVACDLSSGFYGFYASTNAGNVWTERYNQSSANNLLGWSEGNSPGGQGTYDLAIIADATNRDKVYVGGINMWGTDDGGFTWDGMSYWLPYYGDYLHADQHQLNYNPLNSNYYMCNDGGLYRTHKPIIGSWTDANNEPGYEWPTQWEFMSSGMQITSFYRLGLRNQAGDIIAGAQDNSTFYKSNGTWVNIIGGDGMECLLHPTNNQVLYGSYQYGGLVRSLDGGLNTQSLNTPFENGEWTTPFMLEPNNPDIVYAGFENIWRANDGLSFSDQLSNFPNIPTQNFSATISHFCIADNDVNTLYVAKRIMHAFDHPSELYVSRNGGQTWQNRTAGLPDSLYITYTAVHELDASIAWIVVGGFAQGLKVFKTIDAGVNWINISYNLPNIPVNTIVKQKGSELIYIGTDAGVFYLNDTASNWKYFSTNLPNAIVSELEIHYPSQKIYAATFGRGIWMSDLAVLTGVDKQFFEKIQVNLFPTLNKGNFTIAFDSDKNQTIQLEIISIRGTRVHTEELYSGKGKFDKEFHLNLQPGMYFARLLHANESKVLKFIVE